MTKSSLIARLVLTVLTVCLQGLQPAFGQAQNADPMTSTVEPAMARRQLPPAVGGIGSRSASNTADTLEELDNEALEPVYVDFMDFIKQTTGYNLNDVLDMRAPRSLGQRITERYTVGVGDRLEVQIWGSVNGHFELLVDPSGRVFVPQVGSIAVLGVRQSDLGKLIEAQLSKTYKNFNARAVVLQARAIDIQVAGQAKRVGVHTVPGATTVLGAALSIATPRASGSRRFVELKRHGRSQLIDLYCFFRQSCADMPEQLLDGDVLHVPSRSRLVAIAGPVGRPGIYELSEREALDDLFVYAGDVTVSADTDKVHLFSMTRSGTISSRFAALPLEQLCRKTGQTGSGCTPLRDGDIVDIQKRLPLLGGVVTVVVPGVEPKRQPHVQGMRLLDVVDAQLTQLIPRALLTTINSPSFKFASELEEKMARLDLSSVNLLRFDPVRREYLPIRADVLAARKSGRDSEANIALQDGDILVIEEQSEWKSSRENLAISVRVLGEVVKAGNYRFSGTGTLKDALSAAGGATDRAALWSAVILRVGDGRAAINKDLVDRAFAAIRNQRKQQDQVNVGQTAAAAQLTNVGQARASSILTLAEQEELEKILANRELLFVAGEDGKVDLSLELKPNDIVLIPPQVSTVACYGAFFRTGQFTVPSGGVSFSTARDRCGVIADLDPTVYLIKARDSSTCREGWFQRCGEAKGGDVLIAVPSAATKTGIAAFAEVLDAVYKTATAAATLKLLF